jgi:hypothetical protein
MKKTFFLRSFAALFAFIPTFVFAAPLNVNLGNFFDLPPLQIPKILSCSVDGTIKRLDNQTNEISYSVKYTSNYGKFNAPYTVAGTVSHPTANISLYKSGGAISFHTGSALLSLQGNATNTFDFAIKNNPGVTVSASVDGVSCTPKYFKTIQPLLITSPKIDLGDFSINTSSLNVTTSIDIPQRPAVQMQTCQMLIEAAPIDEDSILIGGAISFHNIKVGQYPYTVRGYRNDDPNKVIKYTGVYNAKLDTETGLVFGQEGKAFLFQYDSSDETDAYIITATLGNGDCSAVFFPSRLAPTTVSENTSSTSVNNLPETSSSDTVIVVGLSEEDRQKGKDLGLIEKTGESKSVLVSPNSKQENILNTVHTDGAENKETWDSRDYVVSGLLGAIFISILSYIILKYQGKI